MPRVRARKSGKGRLSGTARKELNEDRSESSVLKAIDCYINDKAIDIMFARVTGHLGMGRVKANLPSAFGPDGGPKQISVQIPNTFGRKGSTPINSQTIVAIFVGIEFNPVTFKPDDNVHFKLTAILNDRQVSKLVENEVVPAWMTVVDSSAVGGAGGAAPLESYVFDYLPEEEGAADEDASGSEEEEKEEDVFSAATTTATATTATTKPAVSKAKAKGAKDKHRTSTPRGDDDVDVDEI